MYQDFILQQLRSYYGPHFVIVNKDWPLITKFWMTDFSPLTALLRHLYSDRGPEPRDPASMLRSYLIFLMTNPEKGITEWVNVMKRSPIYALLSGFKLNDIPGVGTFYDFIKRLWLASSIHIKLKWQKKRKAKPKKGKKGEKAPTATPGRVKHLVRRMMRFLTHQTLLPADRLFEFFQTQILSVSAKLGLLGDLSKLYTIGDGTPVVTAACTRSKSTCTCLTQGLTDCNHRRIYSQPDCDSGLDSSREKCFNGLHLYMISAADSKYDLPLYPKLQPASRHDAVSLVINMIEFNQRFKLGVVDKMLLDAANDAEAIYPLLDHQNIEPFIDLNNRSKKNRATKALFRSKRCSHLSHNGLPMKPNGFDRSQNRQRWRCSNSCGCSTAKYGRTYYTHSADNLRLFPKTVRGSEKWKLTYKRRTSIERSNKREKIDYKLESGRHRSSMMWYMRVYGMKLIFIFHLFQFDYLGFQSLSTLTPLECREAIIMQFFSCNSDIILSSTSINLSIPS